ncbi:MAG: valine--tRNA ligase [Candidatus Curtissbacteria bacterium]|nr:valine--tRNA ligase [Candidatus Curtissbacteria bacterium]MDZ4209595.1 valine--tRNA ligase [Candidatus Curtissbacteria bacterium]
MTKKIFINEKDIYDFWEKEKIFSADLNSKKPKYSLLIPPPNLTGELHLGHAMQHSILDALARFKRMQGFDVLLLPGVDHAGIQFESTFDKKLSREGLTKQKLGRDEWLKKAWEFKEDIYKSVSGSWRMMGLSADWSREVFTLDEKCQNAVFEEFKTYFDKGLIYRGPYIVQWCPRDQTAIEDVEVEYEQRKEKLYYLKYGPLTLATVRPETKFGDTAMAVNPKDARYKDYVGREFEIETLHGKKMMRVIADDAVDPKFGTGVIKVTPGHDFTDYEIGKRNNLPIIHVINKEGKLTDVAGKYAGMKVAAAREAMLPELREKGILVKEEEYVHNVSVCERCKSTVEPIISEEWFVNVSEMAKAAVKVIDAGEIEFFPPNYKKILTEWLSDIHDWCISRSLWWGHRIPVWYKGKEMKVSQESPGEGWKQDEQVLDTWFSSGLWPLSTLGWPFANAQGKPEKTKEFERYFPWDFEISAPEIKYLWIARMIMISNYFTRQVPFKTMFFHGMLRDLQGRKFSKSLGNGIDPIYLIDQWGVDATRMALYTYSIPGRDGRVSKQILDERGKNFRNFGTKIRNIAKFVLELKPQDTNSLRSTVYGLQSKNKDDKWIKEELEKLIKQVTKNLESLELHLAVDDIYNFVWHDLADKYIEKSKSRRGEAQMTLEYVLKNVLIVLHPFMPYLTEEIYQMFDKTKTSIMLEEWPS